MRDRVYIYKDGVAIGARRKRRTWNALGFILLAGTVTKLFGIEVATYGLGIAAALGLVYVVLSEREVMI